MLLQDVWKLATWIGKLPAKESIFIGVHLVGGISRQPLSPIGRIIGGSRFNGTSELHYRHIIPLRDIEVFRLYSG